MYEERRSPADQLLGKMAAAGKMLDPRQARRAALGGMYDALYTDEPDVPGLLEAYDGAELYWLDWSAPAPLHDLARLLAVHLAAEVSVSDLARIAARRKPKSTALTIRAPRVPKPGNPGPPKMGSPTTISAHALNRLGYFEARQAELLAALKPVKAAGGDVELAVVVTFLANGLGHLIPRSLREWTEAGRPEQLRLEQTPPDVLPEDHPAANPEAPAPASPALEPGTETIVAPKRGRGGADYGRHDAPLVAEMHRMVEAGTATSANRAAWQVVKRAAGHGSEESKVKRLLGRYRGFNPVQD